MNEQSDEQLMKCVAEGDVAAYQILYNRHASSVLGLSYRIVGDRATAEEMMQETFWRIWTKADTFSNRRGSFPNWMFGIARNLSIDFVRRQKKIVMEPIPDPQSNRAETSPHLKSDHNVAESAWNLIKHERVRGALAQLSTDQRNVVEWIYFQGKTRRQIAKEQNIPFGTINTRAKLALKKLQHVLEVSGFFEE